jgi:hypothetical protein
MNYLDRYSQDLDDRSNEMLGIEQREARLTLPANMTQPQPVHRAIMLAIDQILTMGLSSGNSASAPVPLRTAVRLLRRLEPVMLEELAKVPEAECLTMMRKLAVSISALADSVDNTGDGQLAVAAAGPAEPPSA